MSQAIPHITITSPDGDQVPVLLFPFPAPDSARVQPWVFFADQLAEPEPEPKPEPNPFSFGTYSVQCLLTQFCEHGN